MRAQIQASLAIVAMLAASKAPAAQAVCCRSAAKGGCPASTFEPPNIFETPLTGACSYCCGGDLNEPESELELFSCPSCNFTSQSHCVENTPCGAIWGNLAESDPSSLACGGTGTRPDPEITPCSEDDADWAAYIAACKDSYCASLGCYLLGE